MIVGRIYMNTWDTYWQEYWCAMKCLVAVDNIEAVCSFAHFRGLNCKSNVVCSAPYLVNLLQTSFYFHAPILCISFSFLHLEPFNINVYGVDCLRIRFQRNSAPKKMHFLPLLQLVHKKLRCCDRLPSNPGIPEKSFLQCHRPHCRYNLCIIWFVCSYQHVLHAIQNVSIRLRVA